MFPRYLLIVSFAFGLSILTFRLLRPDPALESVNRSGHPIHHPERVITFLDSTSSDAETPGAQFPTRGPGGTLASE